MPIEEIEDKLEYIATDLLSHNYKLEDFAQFLTRVYKVANLELFLEKENMDSLEKAVSEFKSQSDAPEPYEGEDRFTLDLLKGVDLKVYPVFKQHPCLIEESSESETPDPITSSANEKNEPEGDDEQAESEEQDSRPSLDTIELTVSTINTDYLPVMKEKPTVNLIK